MKEETTTGNSGDYNVTLSRNYKTYTVPKWMRNKVLRKVHSLYAILHFNVFVWPNIPNKDVIVYTTPTTS